MQSIRTCMGACSWCLRRARSHITFRFLEHNIVGEWGGGVWRRGRWKQPTLLVWSRTTGRPTWHTLPTSHATNTIFLSPGQHKVGGQKWASDTNKKPRTLSVIRSVMSANYWPLTLCQNCLSVVLNCGVLVELFISPKVHFSDFSYRRTGFNCVV